MTTFKDTATRDEEIVNADAEDSAEAMSEDIEPTAEDETTQEESEAAEVHQASDDEPEAQPDSRREKRPIAWSRVLAYGVLPGFALQLALAAGCAPELGSCTRCGERAGLVAFSGAAGGVVCGSCEHSAFELSPEAHMFMVEALGSPLAAAPSASVMSANPPPDRVRIATCAGARLVPPDLRK